MKINHLPYSILFVIALTALTCKTYIPYISLDKYKGYHWNENFSDYDVKWVDQGYYTINIVEVDTVFARKHINYFTTATGTLSQNARYIDTLYLYFIDEYRFIYSPVSRKRIDLTKDLGKQVKLGLYDIYKRPVNDSADGFFVDFYFVNAKVKRTQAYDYGIITMELEQDGNQLRFIEADYPLTYVSRDHPKKQSTAPFSADVLDADRTTFLESAVRNFEAGSMQFEANWAFTNGRVDMYIDGKPFDNVIYSFYSQDSDQMKREYKWNGETVYTEYIKENRLENVLVTW